MKVLITRALEDAIPLAGLLKKRGIDSLIDPMLTIEQIEGDPLDLTDVQALLMTSANGVRAFAGRNSDRSIVVYAVGDATMREAQAQGFDRVQTAAGDVEALANLVRTNLRPEDGKLLHCAGTKTAGDLGGNLQSAGYAYHREVLYQARAAGRLKAETVVSLQTGQLDGVLLYSPRTAALFCDCVRRAGCQAALTDMTAFCLSTAVGEKARQLNWRAIFVAQSPTQAALLKIVLNGV